MKPGDIHWVELPPASGREQTGRRPAVILHDDSYAELKRRSFLIS